MLRLLVTTTFGTAALLTASLPAAAAELPRPRNPKYRVSRPRSRSSVVRAACSPSRCDWSKALRVSSASTWSAIATTMPSRLSRRTRSISCDATARRPGSPRPRTQAAAWVCGSSPAPDGHGGPAIPRPRRMSRRSATTRRSRLPSATSRSATRPVGPVVRGWLVAGPLVGSALVAERGRGPRAQESDAAVPPCAAGRILDLEGKVLDVLRAPSGLEGTLAELGAKVTAEEIRIALAADVLFDLDKADLRPEAEVALLRLAEVLRAYPKAPVRIEGHADSKGSDSYNQKLAERRAPAVKDWLVRKADPAPARLSAHGLGQPAPWRPQRAPTAATTPPAGSAIAGSRSSCARAGRERRSRLGRPSVREDVSAAARHRACRRSPGTRGGSPDWS